MESSSNEIHESTPKNKITTVKLSLNTKNRVEKLRSYKRETYDEILQKLLSILNTCKVNPEKAQARLRSIDRKQKSSRRPSSA